MLPSRYRTDGRPDDRTDGSALIRVPFERPEVFPATRSAHTLPDDIDHAVTPRTLAGSLRRTKPATIL